MTDYLLGKEKSMKKRFSVIVAAYNREDYIRETIDSVYNQTFKDFEFIIVDDGSTDRTWEIIQSYGNGIKSLRQNNQGSEATFRKGASLANGEYLAFLDSDDLLMPHALSVYNRIIEKCNTPPVIMGAMKRFMDGDDVGADVANQWGIEVLKYRDYLSKEIGMGLAQSIIVMKKTAFDEANTMIGRNGIYLYNNDYNLMLQAGTHGPCLIVKRPVTVAYRQHKKQNSLNVEKMGKGLLVLMNMTRNGQCFGGKKRMFEKYAYLGGPIVEWTAKALEVHRPGIAFALLIHGWPMVAAAVIRKIWFRFFRTAPIVLPVDGM
jgi:GT2 family glycosyltransferase